MRKIFFYFLKFWNWQVFFAHEIALSSVADGLVIANATVAGPTAPLPRFLPSMDQGCRAEYVLPALREDDAISFRPANKTIEIQDENRTTG